MFLVGGKKQCRKVRGRFSEYIDGLLSGDERAVVEHHLETCEACSEELEALQMTVQLLNQLPSMPVPRSFAIRAAEATRESIPEHQRPGGLRPVPVVATTKVETGRLSIFDPQRLRWLRPATAFATAALVLLLMLDFLQVIPYEGGVATREVSDQPSAQVMVSPAPGGEADLAELKSEEPPKVLPAPAPESGVKSATDEGADDGGVVPGFTEGVEVEPSDEAGGGWPLRQIEIAIGAVLFALVTMMLLARRQRRKWSRV